MELIRGRHNLKVRHQDCVASIGNFDGVHLGHQAILAQLLGHARALGLPSAVIVFEPQPQEYFAGERAPARLNSLREKYQNLSALGVDRMLCLRFDGELAGMEAEQFIVRVLREGLGIHHLVVGDDFRFGNGRTGDFALLEAHGRQWGFEVERARTCRVHGQRVSSTRVREVLAGGDLAAAEALLGRPYSISGRVVRGHERGRQMGFPTANIDLHRRRAPVAGIFAARVHGLAERAIDGVAYIGSRPVISDNRPVLEVHMFDYHQDCYGRHIRVELLGRLRGDRHFDSFDELQAQIARDIDLAGVMLQEFKR